MLDKKLLAILVCPLCKGPLHYAANRAELVCRADSLAYPIRDGIPVMLDNEARPLSLEEKLGQDLPSGEAS
ncbi:hypothetical protein EV700_1836 [Fluviicoccus keumensis]|uniref:UPF0434 protein EV700_1836 n=1 Tax=Fluviicoccus keumensis TaxID=1435465 RepID=A0A4Q7Z5T3_9GAMM|nr:Trm112 family protein [Fluviicoccus keumensis]RZU45029.1 hypothetical protein EV700_1836 [Fluviicoccus keumensis]